MNVIDTSKRRFLADQVKQLNERGQLGLPLGCDYSSCRGDRWTDRVTGKEYLRLLPALLNEPELGLAPQTVLLLDSIMTNMGPEAGPQFVIDFTDENANTGHGYWHHPSMRMQNKTFALAEWICRAEPIGALGHMIFGKKEVIGIADALKEGNNLHGRWRSLRHAWHRVVYALTRSDNDRPPYDPRANWSVSNTQLRQLLPQLGSLKAPLYRLAEKACLNQENADTWAQHRFKHPIYWAKNLAREGDKIRSGVLPQVLSYSCESLASSAAFLALYAASISGSSNPKVQEREGYILAQALNYLALAHALRACVERHKQQESTDADFDVIASKTFDDAYVEAYKAIAAQFTKVVTTIY